MSTTPSRHVASLVDAVPTFESELGSVAQLATSNFPILEGMTLKRIVLEAGAMREPQWNVNSNQIAYVTAGTVLVSMLATGDEFATFVVKTGQMYHVASGAVYHIENVGEGTAEIIAALRTGDPKHFSLQNSVSVMSDAVLGNTYGLPASDFSGFPRGAAPQIVQRTGAAVIPESAGLPNAHLFDADGQIAPLAYPYGSAKLARKQFWAALEDLSMYALNIGGNGMREPHWHPITAELGYVKSGHARMTVLDPDGSVDTYELRPGQAYFVPRAYPHHIEALGEEGIEFLIFFDQFVPGDVGYRATATAFSREVLSAAFQVPERELPVFPFTPVDPLIVERTNPRDPSPGEA
ncbi:cupin domain-containing protein [Herbiconiux moechotypicola]|uniref:Cupin domain-containing protein n=1 Tax=Herbiconiux moechotypicola TaxID=637393 RepID=A0ABN3E3I7_9MICO|nr:cupin domain-containing protein [Herbiconiux moechotypicola]MCS5731376.1 cupin domain-containing protein [Herbiconiux moechotypicola]